MTKSRRLGGALVIAASLAGTLPAFGQAFGPQLARLGILRRRGALVVARDGPKLKPADATASPSAPMGSLAAILTRVVGRPVVDETGVSGNYRFDLDFAVDTVASTDRPSVFTALQEQLGLRLDSKQVQGGS